MFGKEQTSKNRLEEKFWAELQNSPFLMLGLQGVEDSRTRPMSAQLDGKAIYFFASRSGHLAQGLKDGDRAIATFVAKGHGLFAHLHGTLAEHRDRAMIDKLWTLNIASWYEGGKDDPDLLLLKFDAEKADIWEAESAATLTATAFKTWFDVDPGKEHQNGHKANVDL